jgi:hypothetical protein
VSEAPYTILIVGDWVVDEYWFVAQHHSQLSSHQGLVHYRLSPEISDHVKDLCGAGHVARVLHELRKEPDRRPYELVGLGLWNPGDTELIQHLVHARSNSSCHVGKTSFQLKPQFCTNSTDITLIPLTAESPTIRVIRTYHLRKGRLEQINRIDWEPERVTGSDNLERWGMLQLPDSVRAIVVYDLLKGGVTQPLIQKLQERYGSDVEWYVRSKRMRPDWLKSIGDRLALLVIGPEVAASLRPFKSWLTGGRPTYDALQLISEMHYENVVLLTEEREVIGKFSDRCITVGSSPAANPITQLGWASSVMGALVHIMRERRGGSGESEIAFDEGDVSTAVDTANRLAGVPLANGSGGVLPPVKPPSSPLSWGDELTKWEAARSQYGIIEDPDGPRLDLWRATSHLPGYIACIKEKQQVISRICQSIREFFTQGARMGSLGILLQADPGAGKTYLAEMLADAFGLALIRCDVTQLIHRDELFDFFDSVATVLADERKQVLVYVDEINARLDGDQVYSAFLAPLESGVYSRRGNSFSLRPCVWLFTGTKFDDDKAAEAGEKLSDFKSRMALYEKIGYSSLKDEAPRSEKRRVEDEARLEQVYLGAAMIRKHFPDVQRASEAVLEEFYKLDPAESPARQIRRLASSLRDVQYGKVTRENWHETQLRKGQDRLVTLTSG